jgi:hypothetical protein
MTSQDQEEWKKMTTREINENAISKFDPTFRRATYVRYADDFLIGIIGSHEDCVNIKERLAKFLDTQLKLTLSEQKTKITQATKEHAKFLGFLIKRADPTRIRMFKRKKNAVTQRISPNLGVIVPMDSILERLRERGMTRIKHGKYQPTACNKMLL